MGNPKWLAWCIMRRAFRYLTPQSTAETDEIATQTAVQYSCDTACGGPAGLHGSTLSSGVASVPVGRGHSEVSVDVFFGVPSFLVSHEHVALPVDATDAAHKGRVVVPPTVAMQLHPLHTGGGQELMTNGVMVLVRISSHSHSLGSSENNSHVDCI